MTKPKAEPAATSHPTNVPEYPSLANAVAAVPQIVGQLRGTLDDVPCAIQCAYCVLGYGLSVAVPHRHEAAFAAGPCPDDEAGCDLLEKIGTKEAGAEGFPWALALAFVRMLLDRWLPW